MALSSRYARNVRNRRAAEQDGRCCYCKCLLTAAGPTQATIEHRKAKADGGSDRVANLAAACFHCNQRRGRQQQQARLAARTLPPGGAAPTA